MQINKELTNKYYENYIPCNCGYCKYFIKHIETEQPELREYFETLDGEDGHRVPIDLRKNKLLIKGVFSYLSKFFEKN